MDKIKESFDNLPIAVGFFDANGVVRLVNHRMLALSSMLRKNGVQTLAEMQIVLQTPPANICCLDPQFQIYRFPDDKVFRFLQEQITTKAGIQYTQITATDVTELMRRQTRLKEENAKLMDANNRLRKIFEQMPEIIREEEMLDMKMRVHDDIGHNILAARRALLRQAELDELRASAALWEQSIAVLYRSNQMCAQYEPLEEAIRRAGEMGVRVLTEGTSPKAPKVRTLTALAIRECAANCARHAGGTELYVRFRQDRDVYTNLCLTNNGEAPREEIREGGGLSMLRHRVEEMGGSMEIQSIPCFRLSLSLPEKEVTKHEGHDC